MKNLSSFDLQKLNSMTKYPSILTYHELGDKGMLQESLCENKGFKENEEVFITEKVDGCLHYSSTVLTDNGIIPIGKIVEKKLPVKVLSYNINKDILEYKDIEYYHKEEKLRPFISIGVKSRKRGNKPKYIACTDNHKFFSNGEWVQAKELNIGQNVSHLIDTLSYEIKQVILGSLLGDGSIYRPTDTTRGFSIIHSITQSDYFEFKKMLLNNIFKESKSTKGGFDGSKQNRRGNSIVNYSISKFISDYCEVDNKKKITKQWVDELSPLGLAIWYMDDGSCNFNTNQRPRVRFSTNGFSLEEVNLLKDMLKNKYNIKSKIFNYKGNTLCLTVDGTEKLFSIIFPYICDSMKYKLSKKYLNYKCVLDKPLETYISIIDTEVVSISNELPQRCKLQNKFQYDLTVKDNSNYFTNSILVHNTNGRIIVYNGDYMIGSREDILYAKGDRIINSTLGIVDTLRSFAEKLCLDLISEDHMYIIFSEVYGGNVTKASKQYTNSKTWSFRLFDVCVIKPEVIEKVMDMSREKIASWRDNGGQLFIPEYDLNNFANMYEVKRVPFLTVINGIDVPMSLSKTYEFLSYFENSKAIINSESGKSEGIVVRNKDRSMIRKIRFEDYEKTKKRGGF